MAKKNLPYPAEKIGKLLIEVDNEVAKKSDLNDFVKKESGRGLSTNDYSTAEKNKLAGIQEGAQKNTVTSVRGALQLNPQVGNVVISAADIGLGNANTRLTSLENNKLDKSEKGATNGVASLDENGRVPSSQLPSYVDDVIEVANYESLPTSGESGKIYITQSDNKTYRWSGNGYAEVSASLALGETEQTAYSGAKGKQNAEDIAKLAKDLDETHQLASNAESAISEVVELTIPAIESNVANKATKSEAQGYATTAKSEAIAAAATDAQNKANTAESNAKTYADGKVKGLADGQVATNTTAIASLQTAQTSTATTVKSHSDTISTHTQQITNLDSNKLGKTEKAADSAKADSATTATTASRLGGTMYEYRSFTKNDNSGWPMLLLLSECTDLYNGNASSAKQYGFTGIANSSRSEGLTTQDNVVLLTARHGYSSTSASGRALYTSHSYLAPKVVKYNDKYYVALIVTGSSRTIALVGKFYNALEEFIKLNYTSASALPSGVEIIQDGNDYYRLNALSATKLATPRTIWGQSFDGTADVNGNLILYNADDIDNGNASSSKLVFGGSAAWRGPYIEGVAGGGWGMKNLVFYQYNTQEWPGDYSKHYAAMTLDIHGKLGIGTTSPTEKLDVNGNVKAAKFIGALQGNADSATNASQLGGVAASGYAKLSGGTFTGAVGVNGQLRINAPGGGNNTKNCGIIKAETVYTNRALVHIGSNYGYAGEDASSASNVVYAMGMYNGAIGIGRVFTVSELSSAANDGRPLTVAGNALITGTMTATASYHDMNYTTSDERLKDFEGDVEVDLEKLKTLPKKYFKWKEHPERGRTLGTSAQALQKIYPELVATRTDGMLSVNYEGLAMVALAGIDKLAEQNAELERRLAKIEKLLNIE